jgi:hypothetical protein
MIDYFMKPHEARYVERKLESGRVEGIKEEMRVNLAFLTGILDRDRYDVDLVSTVSGPKFSITRKAIA